jgi:L-methionine (R)-S-oxide reductase
MKVDFAQLLNEFVSWFDPKEDRDITLARTASFLKEKVYHYDWVGFYILDKEKNELVLGPYSGKPTEHTNIPVGKGVCGQVAESKSTKIVQDVSQESNYISCSIDVQSEIVVPVLKDGLFVAEIDIDSHSPAPFSNADDEFLSAICDKISQLF